MEIYQVSGIPRVSEYNAVIKFLQDYLREIGYQGQWQMK